MDPTTLAKLWTLVQEKKATIDPPSTDAMVEGLTPAPGTVANWIGSGAKWVGDTATQAANSLFGRGDTLQESARKQLLGAEQTYYNNLANRHILGMGAMALGAGAGIRGLQGLFNGGADTHQFSLGPTSAPVPYPVKRKEEPGEKRAWGLLNVPYYGAGMGAAGIGGFYAGYKGVDHLLRAQQEQARQSKLDKAKADFEQALIESYPKPLAAPAVKTGSEDTMTKVGQALDSLFDKMQPVFEKMAQNGGYNPTSLADNMGLMANLYGPYALGTGLLGGALAYDYATKQQPERNLEQAAKLRARQRMEQSPVELVPQPIEV